jgi:hypothetical protein
MSNSYHYRQVSDTLAQSLTNFNEVDLLFGNSLAPSTSEEATQNEADQQTNLALKERWHNILTQGHDLAQFVKGHYRPQSSQVLSALEELAKYTDVRRPFRLSVIGQKGVGKSALVNALLGASQVQYTPSEVAGKAVSGTRIRLTAYRSEEQPGVWQVVFLTPQRLWEIGIYLLAVARLKAPRQPADLNQRQQVITALQSALDDAKNSNGENNGNGLQPGTTMQIQATNARETLATMLKVYREQLELTPADYQLWLDDPDVDGTISPYIRQTESNLYLIVDYVMRYLPAGEGGLIAGRPIELEDVLGLDDPRDSFFAIEAFKEAFAVIMVFKCDRGLNTESKSLLEQLFSRDEAELSRFGDYADLNKAIVVANQFDTVTGNIATGMNSNPLKGIEDIQRELSRYTRQPVPIYLTSAQIAQQAQAILAGSSTRPSAAYSSYLESLTNLLQVVTNNTTNPAPDYLDFILAKRAEIEGSAFDLSSLQANARARLILELSGLPRLSTKVQQALEASSILRGRVANAEYYYSRAISESALCYARQMQPYQLDLSEFNQPPASLESRLFSKFQHEIRLQLEDLDQELKQSYFRLAQHYIHGPMPAEAEQARQRLLETIRQVMLTNRQLIVMEQHISTGETVTDSWRRIFEDINDWLALETGRQLRALVGPMLAEIEQLAAGMQKKLTSLAASPLDESFWSGYQNCLARLRQRLQSQAEVLALGFYTDHRFSVYDLQIAEALHVGEATKRREAVVRLMQDRLRGWYNNLWHLLMKVAMTDLAAFVAELRHYVLGLSADASLKVGFDLMGRGEGLLAPEESLTAILNQRYHTSESFRKQYAMREPTPAERLAAEIREWLSLVKPPLNGLDELAKASAIAGVAPQLQPETPETEGAEGGQAEGLSPSLSASAFASNASEAEYTEEDEPSENIPATNPTSEANPEEPTPQAGKLYTRLRFPIESRHPYRSVTRQVWEITNPDEEARYTRLHFSRIELGQPEQSSDRISLRPLGRQEQQIISGQHTDFWSLPFPGRTITVNFTADNATPGWGFVLDAVESMTEAEVAELLRQARQQMG